MPTVTFKQLWIAFLLSAVTLFAQNVPVISPGGIVNAASYNLASTSVAPGSIATIFGTNLSDGTVCVTPCGPSFDKNGVLIPTLAGASVTFNGFPAPVLSVPSPSQISVQVPVEMAGSSSAAVVVTVNGHSSAPVNVPLSPIAPGLFSATASGGGQGAILNVFDANVGIASLTAPWYGFPSAHSAQAGDVIEIYATGLGALTAPVATGTRPTGTPQTATMPTVTIGGVPAAVLFAGEAPCCVGLNQINVTVPAIPGTSGVANYSAVPIAITIGGQTSNTVTVAIGTTIGSVSGTAQSVSGKVNPGTRMGLDLPPGASSTGVYTISGNSLNSSGQTVYSLTGSGSGTVSSCALAGSETSGNWTASGAMTLTINPAATQAGVVLGSYSASTSFTLCDTALSARITNGAVLGFVNPSGSVSLILVLPGGGPALWPLTGTVDTGVSGLLITGGEVFGSLTQVTGGITVTGSLQGSASPNQTYTLAGSGSGTVLCSLVSSNYPAGQTGPWSISVSSTFTLSPPPASLVSTGGSVSGTYSGFAGTGTACSGGPLNPISWQGGTVIGTVFPGGGITLTLTPKGNGIGP